MNPTTSSSPTARRRTRRPSRRHVLAATVLGGLLLATGCGESSRGEIATQGFGTDGGGVAAPTTDTLPPSTTTPPPPPQQPESEGGGGGQPQNDDDGGNGNDGVGDSDAGGEMEPWDDGDEEPVLPGPCADVLATGALLMVDPEPALLESGLLESALTITNCGADPVDWTATTIPGVALAAEGGQVAGDGSTTELGFTIVATEFEPGAIEFKIKVSEPGHNHYVDVHAFRDVLGSDFAGDLGLTADDSVGGCAVQCIVSAQITANATSPDVTLEVGLNESAVVDVYVDTQAPADPGGVPVFPGVSPIATSGGATGDFTTSLSPLQAATKYHIIVKATDSNGNVSYRSGSFRTITPVELPDQILDPGPPVGCFVQCITGAELSLTDDPTEMAITVDTHTSAMLDVWVSTEPPLVLRDAPPSFGEGVEKAATTDGLDLTHWEAVIPGLEIDTDYHVILRARDLNGNDSYQVGTFHSAAGYVITVRFHAIHVVDDGDGGDGGELTFRWGTEDNPFGYASVPASSGQAFLIGNEPDDVEMTVESDGGLLPTFYMSADEFDDAEILEACPEVGVYTYFGEYEDCGITWNSAGSGLITPEAFEGMPRCSEFQLPDEWADEACTTIVSYDQDQVGFSGYPIFWAVVAFDVSAH
jgi:hypothetical protein